MKLLFCFLPFSLPSPWSLLKLPNVAKTYQSFRQEKQEMKPGKHL